MVSLNFVFWMYVVLFSVIGGMRGWAKEVLVSFSVILALAFINLLERYVPFIRDTLVPQHGSVVFWMRALILILLVGSVLAGLTYRILAGKMTGHKTIPGCQGTNSTSR